MCARKPLIGTVAANVLAHGTGALNINACRILTSDEQRIGSGATWDKMHEHEGRGRAGEASAQRRYGDRGGTNFAATPGPRGGDPSGRWPANVALSYPADEYRLRDDVTPEQLEELAGWLRANT